MHRGKGIIVTGAAGGIGRAIAEHLLAEGASVVVADLKDDSVRATAASLGGKSFGVADGYRLARVDRERHRAKVKSFSAASTGW